MTDRTIPDSPNSPNTSQDEGTSGRKLPRTFHRILTASAVSSLGDGIYFSALPLLAVSLTHNAVLLGAMGAASLLPWLLFGLIGGALVDRWDRRRTMWITDVARFGLLAGTVAAVAAGMVSIYVLLVVAFLLGIGEILFDTAAMAYLPELLDREHDALNRANSRLQGVQRVTDGFVGPPTGSVLFTVSRTLPLVVNAFSFAFSALLIRSLPPTPQKPPKPKTSLLKDARVGASYLFGHKLLLGLALRPAVGNFAFMGVQTVLVLFARDTLHLSTSAYGVFLTTEAVGGLAGTGLAGPLMARLGTGGTLTLTALVEAAALLGIGESPNAYWAGAGFAVLGAAMGATMVLGPSVRQAIVPDELMGRVSAAARLTAYSAGPLGALFGGWLANVAGLRAPFVVGAGVLLLMAGVAARLTSNKRINAALAEAAAARDAAAADDGALVAAAS